MVHQHDVPKRKNVQTEKGQRDVRGGEGNGVGAGRQTEDAPVRVMGVAATFPQRTQLQFGWGEDREITRIMTRGQNGRQWQNYFLLLLTLCFLFPSHGNRKKQKRNKNKQKIEHCKCLPNEQNTGQHLWGDGRKR